MNRAFKEVYAFAFPKKNEILSHRQRVTRLYRRALKLQFDWAFSRDIFIEEAQKIRDQFDANKNCTMAQAEYYIKQADEKMDSMWHPEPYRIPWMPGGSKFMRNPTPPPEVVYRYYDEIPESAYTGTNTPMHLDSIPISWRPVDKE